VVAGSGADARWGAYQVRVHLRRRLLELHFPDTRNLYSAASDGLRRETAVVQLRRRQSEESRADGWARTYARTHTHTQGPVDCAPPFVSRTPPCRIREKDGGRERERETLSTPSTVRVRPFLPTSDERLLSVCASRRRATSLSARNARPRMRPLATPPRTTRTRRDRAARSDSSRRAPIRAERVIHREVD